MAAFIILLRARLLGPTDGPVKVFAMLEFFPRLAYLSESHAEEFFAQIYLVYPHLKKLLMNFKL